VGSQLVPALTARAESVRWILPARRRGADVFFFPQLLQAGLHHDVLRTGVRLMV
jgi:hypothetical protein